MPDFFTSPGMMFTPSCAFEKCNITEGLSELTCGVGLLTRWEGPRVGRGGVDGARGVKLIDSRRSAV